MGVPSVPFADDEIVPPVRVTAEGLASLAALLELLHCVQQWRERAEVAEAKLRKAGIK